MNAAVSEEIAKDTGLDKKNIAGAAIFAAPSANALAALKERQKKKGRISTDRQRRSHYQTLGFTAQVF